MSPIFILFFLPIICSNIKNNCKKGTAKTARVLLSTLPGTEKKYLKILCIQHFFVLLQFSQKKEYLAHGKWWIQFRILMFDYPYCYFIIIRALWIFIMIKIILADHFLGLNSFLMKNILKWKCWQNVSLNYKLWCLSKVESRVGKSASARVRPLWSSA